MDYQKFESTAVFVDKPGLVDGNLVLTKEMAFRVPSECRYQDCRNGYLVDTNLPIMEIVCTDLYGMTSHAGSFNELKEGGISFNLSDSGVLTICTDLSNPEMKEEWKLLYLCRTSKTQPGLTAFFEMLSPKNKNRMVGIFAIAHLGQILMKK